MKIEQTKQNQKWGEGTFKEGDGAKGKICRFLLFAGRHIVYEAFTHVSSMEVKSFA